MGTVKKLHTRMVWMMLNAFDMVWPVGFHLAIPDLLEHWLFLPHFAWWKSGHKFLWCPSGCFVSRSLPAEKPLKTIKNQEDYDYLHRLSKGIWFVARLPFPARSPGQFLAPRAETPFEPPRVRNDRPPIEQRWDLHGHSLLIGMLCIDGNLWVMMPCSWYSLGNYIAIRLDCN